MQIYQIKLVFSKEDKFISTNLYYAVLWAVLNIFENDEEIYKHILKISFSFTKENFFIFISILWKEFFDKVVSILLELKDKTISINSHKFVYENLSFDLKEFNLENFKPKLVNEFSLKFLSPTQIRNQNKIFVLPTAERFLFSVYTKLSDLGLDFDIDEKDFKKWLSYSVLAKKVDIKTQVAEIKKSKRAWIVWYVSYIVYDKNEDYQKLLSLLLEAIPYVWVGSGVRLGLGNVRVKKI